MSLAKVAADLAELLRFKAMIERRINAKSKELASLEEQLDEIDKKLEEGK
jgi:hypothetical protein